MFSFNGTNYTIPGVYGILKVIQLAGSTLPDFNVGLVIAKAPKGTPYTASTKGSEVMLAYSDPGAVARDYGYGDVYTAFTQLKKIEGTGAVFIVNIAPNTQAQFTLEDEDETESVTIKARPKKYGVFANDEKFSITEGASSEVLDSGTATSATGTTLVDSAQTFTEDALIGKWVRITAGTGRGQVRKITDNDTTSVTVATWTTNPDATSTYEIVEPNWTITQIPTKSEKIITANVTTGNYYCYVNSYRDIQVGLSYDIMNNPSGKIGSFVVKSVNTTYNSANGGYKVIFETAIGSSAVTTANYARLVQLDQDNKIQHVFENSEWNVDNVVETMNSIQQDWEWTKHASGVKAPDALAEQYVGQIPGATKAINIAPTTNDYLAFADRFPSMANEFESINRVNIRHIGLGTPDSAVMASFKALGNTMANAENQKPQIVHCGMDLNKTASEYITLAKTLNKDRVVLYGGGLDGLPAYLSFNFFTMGILIANDVRHNLTNDIVDATAVEKNWTSEELKQLTKNGVFTYKNTSTGYRITRGINTYQNQEQDWNENDAQTHVINFRQVADFVHVGVMRDLAPAIGQDGLTPDDVVRKANAIGQKYINSGHITQIRVRKVSETAQSVTLRNEFIIPGIIDFIGVENYVVATS